ncbi:hypothetical protein HJFPF1_02164 [Paramyrothecium foliicola]|nr:hypothetical protein HJFPF1_02164 [Paramyrothecium foliicola]
MVEPAHIVKGRSGDFMRIPCISKNSNGSAGFRCQRLGKTCEPPVATRKRKAPSVPATKSRPPPEHRTLEEKLDNIVTLLQSQNMTRHDETGSFLARRSSDQATLSNPTTGSLQGSSVPSPAYQPEFALNTADSYLNIERPTSPITGSAHTSAKQLSLIELDVGVHEFLHPKQDEYLELFRKAFLPNYPCIHILAEMPATELRYQKPFTWLVIMALTEKNIANQFEIEETIWKVISRRTNVDVFNQFTQCVIILFKLTNLTEVGWCPENVKSRTNVLQILDDYCETIMRIPEIMGMEDAPGERHGLFFKATLLLRTIKELMLAETRHSADAAPKDAGPRKGSHETAGGLPYTEDPFLFLEKEPWLSDLYESTWNFVL